LNLDTAPADIFVHVISVPAAGPWDQSRAARMSAELGAPLPAGQSSQCLRRLDRWSPGRPGRFAIGYMRASQAAGDRIRTVLVEGRTVRFVFQDPLAQEARRRAWLVNAGLAAGAAFCLVVAGWTWSQRRDETVEVLATRTRQANIDLRAHRLQALQARNLARMQPADLLGRTGSKVAADLAWLDTVRDRRSKLTGVVWEDRTLRVSTASGQAPVVGAAGGKGGQWRIDPPTVGAVRAKPSVVSRAPRQSAP
jgi:hypothetical protein